MSVASDQYRIAEIFLSDGIRLKLFPDGSLEEDWRFFKTNTERAFRNRGWSCSS